jgi:hypothetical protein
VLQTLIYRHQHNALGTGVSEDKQAVIAIACQDYAFAIRVRSQSYTLNKSTNLLLHASTHGGLKLTLFL